MSPVNIRNQPEDRTGLFRTGISGYGHHSGWKDTEGNNTHTDINLLLQQELQNRGLEGYGSSSSAPPTRKRSITMEH
ncbi:hypothetical protein O181_095806 [Austropuccinia psidii MF-1]|uniref:Uncharacterized protein n=1 Tax=Austropuccinia psidii MF-1 TaxID=1389203 RepID=A0A9Q3J5W6_9BASI|nr:hypothetical protein [Austropuccinia psidii MF-1]